MPVEGRLRGAGRPLGRGDARCTYADVSLRWLDDGSESDHQKDQLGLCVATREDAEQTQKERQLAKCRHIKGTPLLRYQPDIEHAQKDRVTVLCSAPEFSLSGDKVMVGLFLMCELYGDFVKFGYDWGGSDTAEGSDANPERVVPACCHSLACSVAAAQPGDDRSAVDRATRCRGLDVVPKVQDQGDGDDPGGGAAEGRKLIELAAYRGPVSHRAAHDAADHGRFTQEGDEHCFLAKAEITIFMRCVEYTEFFDRFVGYFGCRWAPFSPRHVWTVRQAHRPCSPASALAGGWRRPPPLG